MAKAYSFLDTQATIAGAGGVVNMGAGAGNAKEGITITRNADRNRMVIGADGTPMNTLSADKSGSAMVRLLKTSPVNAQLMSMYNTQSLSGATWGQNTIVVSLTGVGDVHTLRDVSFKKVPDMTYAEEAGMVEWSFDCGRVDSVLGTF